MDKNSQQNDSANSIQKSHARGRGVFHVLKYQNWHNQLKKKLPHKRLGASKHAKGHGNPGDSAEHGCPGNSEDVTSPHSDKTTEHKNSGKNKSTVDGKVAGSKTSVRSRLKALIYDELTKRKNRLRREDPLAYAKPNDGSPTNSDNKSSSASSLLDPSMPKTPGNQNIEEDHTIITKNHLEYRQVNEMGKQIIENLSPLQQNSDIEKQDLTPTEDFDMEASVPQSKDILDALDLINTNRELLLNIFQDQGSQLADHFDNQQAFGSKVRFYNKSLSFPARGPSITRGSVPRELKSKEKIEAATKELKFRAAGFQAQKAKDVKAKRYSRSSSMLSVAAQYTEEKMLKLNHETPETPESSASGSAPHLKNRRHNQVVIRRFKNLSRKIKHAIKDSKWEKSRIALDAIVHKIPHGHTLYKDLKKETASSTSKESTKISYKGDDNSISLTRKKKHSMSRTSSLLQSLDKYCQLYESTFNKEAKHSNAETSMSRYEGTVSHRMSASKSMGRNFSLPYHKSCPHQGKAEVSADGFPGAMSPSDLGEQVDSSRASEDISQSDSKVHAESDVSDNLENGSNLFAYNELGTTSTSNPEVELSSGFENFATGDVASHYVHDILPQSKPITESEGRSFAQVPRHKFLEAATSHPSFSFPKVEIAPELSFKHVMIPDKPEEEPSSVPTVGAPSVVEEIEFPSEDLKNEILQVNVKDKAKLDYVSYILELSGFSGTASLRSWQSEDHPLDPSMVEEVAGYMLLDPECSGNDQDENDSCYRLLLFDLINEILMEIYAKSYSYWPKPLSSLSRVHPMPVGHHVLEEVWTGISWYLSSRPHPDRLLDHLLCRDLANNYGWMNLQFDSEFVALQLEDLVFNELVEGELSTIDSVNS